MTVIFPRWEWRWFGPRLGSAESKLAALTPVGVQESSETYLLSGAGDNVKVRDALMDIKVLREVDRNGLEQWTPVMKAGFPLPATEVAKVFEALRLDPLPLRRASYSLEEFISELAVPSGRIRAVNVDKRRTRYTVGGCMAELSEVVADGKPTRTVAVESEGAAAVIAAVRSLGLSGYVNTSYPRGLAALIDGEPLRFAVIDVGTNSIKFHIGERDRDGKWRTVVDRAEMTRLGEGLEQHGVIADAALERTAAAIADMVDEAKRHEVLATAAVGTAGLRIASNRDVVLAAIEARTGLCIDVISGEEEGRLAYVAARSGLGLSTGSLVAFDTGGGSTQFTFGHDSSVDERFSVDVGAVRYTERYKLDGVVSAEVLRGTMAAIAADLSRIDGRRTAQVTVFQRTAGVLRCTRSSGHQDGLAGPAGPDLPAQGQAQSEELRPPRHRRNVAVSRWLADPRGFDQVPARRGLPGRRRVQGLPGRKWNHADRERGNEDEGGNGVFRTQAQVRAGGRLIGSIRPAESNCRRPVPC